MRSAPGWRSDGSPLPGLPKAGTRLEPLRLAPQTNVVDVLVCRVRNNIEKGFDKKLIKTLRGMGYVLEGS